VAPNWPFATELPIAFRYPAPVGADLPAFLSRHGYARTSDKTHIQMAPPKGLLAAHPVTTPQTPGDLQQDENRASRSSATRV
jgi:hypothetical protein